MKTALLISSVAMFLMVAACVWLPFTSHDVVFNPGLNKNRPAGQIVKGFSLSEVVPPLLPQSSGTNEPVDCIALRFATYMRRNDGTLKVDWYQGERGHQWILDTSKLEDNSFVDLCLDSLMNAAEPFVLEISGMDGKPGASATVWLTGSRGSTVNVNGRQLPGFGLALRLSKEKRVGVSDLLHLDNGTFAAGFLCSLLIGMIALLSFPAQQIEHG